MICEINKKLKFNAFDRQTVSTEYCKVFRTTLTITFFFEYFQNQQLIFINPDFFQT